MRIDRPNLIADALFNVEESSGASDDYARGVVIGVVSALMAVRDYDFKEIVPIIVQHIPHGYKDDRVPLGWVDAIRKEWQRVVDEKTEQARLLKTVNKLMED